MKYLYLWLDIGSFIIPFLFSFHPRLKFYRKWRSLFVGIAVMMLIFIPWDILFTAHGVWGFNQDYLSGIAFFGLPIEEWLFFICIPYACIFTHYALIELLPSFKFSDRFINIVAVVLMTVMIFTLWYFFDRWYTLVNFIYGMLIIGIAFNYNKPILRPFFATYLVILIPFFIVNGILTGSGLESPVVWYNNDENLGLRLSTIPVEDLIYNLGMLLTVLYVMEAIEKKKRIIN